MQYCTYVVGISWAIAIMYCTSKLASAQIFNPLHIGVICSPTDDEGETVWYRGIDMSDSDREEVRTKSVWVKVGMEESWKKNEKNKEVVEETT